MSDTYPFRFPHVQYGITFTNRGQWVAFLKKEAEARAAQAGIPPGIMSGLIEQESSWNGYRSGKNKNGTLDAGLTQINQSNWGRFRVKHAEELGMDPLRAIDAGTVILKEAIDTNGGNMFLALSAYQRGQGNLNKSLRGEQEVPAVAKDYPVKVLLRAAKYGAPMPKESDLLDMPRRLGYTVDLVKARKAAGIEDATMNKVARVQDQYVLPPQKETIREAEALAMLEADQFSTPEPVPSLLPVTDDLQLARPQETALPAPEQYSAPLLDESLLAVDQELDVLSGQSDVRRRVAEAFGGKVESPKTPDSSMDFVDSIVETELENA